jgi:cell division protease FtsH
MDYGDSEGGYMGAQAKPMSEQMAQVIDDEVRSVIDKNYQRAEEILKDNIEVLHNMAQALMDWETIDKHQIERLLQGEKIDPPEEEPEDIEIKTDSKQETSQDDDDIPVLDKEQDLNKKEV